MSSSECSLTTTGHRRAPRTVHADLVFSRTGITRVGTVAEAWDGAWRRFRGDPPDQSGIAVTPARYAAFLAEARRPLAADPIMGRRDERNDPHRTFLFPVHKLFSGRSCIAGATITLDFKEYHRNEKLKRIHAAGGVKVAKGFDINKPPFVRDLNNTDDLVALRRVGDSVLVVAQSHDQLVRAAEQKNSVSRKNEIARFLVPPGTDANRFSSSLHCRRRVLPALRQSLSIFVIGLSKGARAQTLRSMICNRCQKHNSTMC